LEKTGIYECFKQICLVHSNDLCWKDCSLSSPEW
jgi:hypothetical protein